MEKNYTILIVDNEEDIVNLAERFLKMADFNTITCTNGKEALEILKEKHDSISLVLLDIMMPGISGFDVLKEIKTDNLLKHILVYMFTVKNLNEDIQKSKDLGADGFITKPFSGTVLIGIIKKALNIE